MMAGAATIMIMTMDDSERISIMMRTVAIDFPGGMRELHGSFVFRQLKNYIEIFLKVG